MYYLCTRLKSVKNCKEKAYLFSLLSLVDSFAGGCKISSQRPSSSESRIKTLSNVRYLITSTLRDHVPAKVGFMKRSLIFIYLKFNLLKRSSRNNPLKKTSNYIFSFP